MNGALIFLCNTDYQFNFSNQGCSLIYLAELWPSLLLWSLWSSFFSKSCSLGVNLIRLKLLLKDQGFCRQLLRRVPSYSHFWKVEILLTFSEASILNTTNQHPFHARFSLLFPELNIQEFRKSTLQSLHFLEFSIDRNQSTLHNQLYRWWYFLVSN